MSYSKKNSKNIYKNLETEMVQGETFSWRRLSKERLKEWVAMMNMAEEKLFNISFEKLIGVVHFGPFERFERAVNLPYLKWFNIIST